MVHATHTKFHVVANVLESGYDGNLAKGQLAVVKNKAVKGQGKEVVSDFAGMTQKDLIAIEVGELTTPSKLRTFEVPYKSTGFFPIGSIVDIKGYAPTNVTLKVDELEIGYDGINDSTALFIPEGKAAVLDIVVEGHIASMFFGQSSYIIQKRVSRKEDQSMQEVIQKLVKELNDDVIPTATGWASTTDTLSQFLDIKTIDSTAVEVNGIDSVFSTLTLTDNGDSNDLADIQAQYPLYTVTRTARNGGVSTYTILRPSTASLADYAKVTVDVDAKGCEDCLAGYDEVEGGYVYHIAIEDDGTDQTAALEADLSAEISVTKFGNKDGRGLYSALIPAVMTDAENTNILTGFPTAEISYKGEVKDVCSDSTTVSTAWVAGETCTAIQKNFTIILKDNECGESRLAELQAAYPDLTIVEGAYTGTATQTVTVSADVALAIIVDGVTYNTADAGTTTQTAAAFVTAHAAAILSATGAVVTNPSTNVILFTHSASDFPVITSAAQTVGAVTYGTTTSNTAGGCKRSYSTKVVTNITCDECDDIFLQPYYASAPEPFGSISWVEEAVTYSSVAKMGISIKGKPFFLYPEAIEEDFIPYVETSLKIKSASFGWREDDILNYTGEQYDVDLEFARVERVQEAQDVDNLSESLFGAEDEGNLFGTNKKKYKANLFSRANLSQERILKYHKRMLKYVVEFRDQGLSQGGGSRSDITHGFGIIVEEGKHESIQTLLGKLAAKVGLEAPVISVV
jgi:hypothetical protein